MSEYGDCVRRTPDGEAIGEPCPDCGHTNLLHPGPTNPGLGACLACDYYAGIRPGHPYPGSHTKASR